MKKILHIGFDDTDSIKGSCTTYLATLVINEIFDQISFLDFPNLIRLNPNIPYKTRGNGAVAIRIIGDNSDLEYSKEVVIRRVKELSMIEDENTNPGIVFVEGEIPNEVKEFSRKAMWDVLTIKEAESFEKNNNIALMKFKLGRGIIGALSAIGNSLENDFTYEHLSYRLEENFGKKRAIDESSVFIADKETPLTFNNIDYEYNSILITPRGADPVFTGIRGETVEEVRKAWSLIQPLEKISKQMIFRTNQHTNQHFVKQFKISELEPYLSIITSGTVSKKPRYIEGSHLIFTIQDESGKIDCAAYEPTKRFRGQLNNLEIGDNITIFGGMRPAENDHDLTINVERLRVNSLVKKFNFENPFCSICNTRLKSAGKNKGFKCPKCSTRFRELEPIAVEIPREIQLGEYLPPLIAQRHLTRPQIRDHRNNKGNEKNQMEINEIIRELVNLSLKNE
ncbi:MAG: DUF1743 domain-containing protein [Candidatus Thorarchaeota archaeon]